MQRVSPLPELVLLISAATLRRSDAHDASLCAACVREHGVVGTPDGRGIPWYLGLRLRATQRVIPAIDRTALCHNNTDFGGTRLEWNAVKITRYS